MAPSDDTGDLRARLVSVEHRSNDHKGRIVALENWRQKAEMEAAVSVERWNAVRTDIATIKDDQKWLIRLVLGGIVLAIIAFIVGGGLRIPLGN